MEHAGNTWFDGLSIDTLRPDDPEKNAYPVVKLDLKGLSTDSFDSFLETFRLGWPSSTGAIRRPGIGRGCQDSASR